MNENAKKEKEITFKRIREDISPKLTETIQNCYTLRKYLGLPDEEIPNIVVLYNNKIIEIEKEFNKAKIDFYDREKCEARFIIENRLQGAILTAKDALSNYISVFNISKQQLEDFLNSYKKPSLFERIFKGEKYEPKESLFTPQQIEKSKEYFNIYMNCYNKVRYFSIKNDIIESILYYRILAAQLHVQNFDSRIDKIDYEIQRLGYSSIKKLVLEQMLAQDLSIANINNLESVPIPAKIISFKK